MVEVEESIHVISDEIETKEYAPSAQTSVFIEDVQMAICHIDNCEYKMDSCTHRRLATDLIKAMLDHYAGVLEKKGQPEAAAILRSEM